MMWQRLFCSYIRWRYSGDAGGLKPPLGYCEYIPVSTAYKVRYWFAYRLWKIEDFLFEKHGQAMRKSWEDWFSANR